jgi:hypothetical protein
MQQRVAKHHVSPGCDEVASKAESHLIDVIDVMRIRMDVMCLRSPVLQDSKGAPRVLRK